MVYIDRFEGRGIGPEIIAPVDFAVFTIFSVDLSREYDHMLLNLSLWFD